MQSILDVRWKLSNKGKALLIADCSNVIDQANVAAHDNANSSIANADRDAEKTVPAQSISQQIPVQKEEAISAQAAAKTASQIIVTENVASEKPVAQASDINTQNQEADSLLEKETTSSQESANSTALEADTAAATNISNTAVAASTLPQSNTHSFNAQTTDIPQAEPSTPVTGLNAPFDEIPLPDDEFFQTSSSAENTAVANSVAQNLKPANEAHIQKRAPSNDGIMPRTNWHLRKKRADIYIEDDASVPYLAGLKEFLKSKGISSLPFNAELHYLPYDILLLNKAHYQNEGICAFLDEGKASIWAFLQHHFKGRI